MMPPLTSADEFRVNTATSGNQSGQSGQSGPKMAVLTDGRVVPVRLNDGLSRGIPHGSFTFRETPERRGAVHMILGGKAVCLSGKASQANSSAGMSSLRGAPVKASNSLVKAAPATIAAVPDAHIS